MKNKLKVLLATDFSRNSRISLHNLKFIKEKIQLNISFIHVIASFWKDWLVSGMYKKEAAQRLKSWQQEIIGESKPKNLFVGIGNRADTILSKAQELKVDLIVLGGKDTQSKGRYKSGTTVENVVRNAKQSVLVCKNEKISKILCGIDGSASSAKALEWAIELAHRFNVKLTILFVISKISTSALGMEEKEILQDEANIEKENTYKIEQFLKKFDFSTLDVDKQYRWGVPAHVLLDAAEDFEYDMIVIGAKGHSRLHHVLMGSTAEKILRFSPCSLMVVR